MILVRGTPCREIDLMNAMQVILQGCAKHDTKEEAQVSSCQNFAKYIRMC